MGTDRRFSLLLLIVLIPGFSICLAAADTGSYTTPDIGKTEWRAAVAIFETTETDPGTLSAAAVMPRLIREEIAGIETHILGGAELLVLSEAAIRKNIQASYKSLADLHAKRDAEFFKVNSAKTELDSLEEKIAAENASLFHWQGFPAENVTSPDDLPVVLPPAPEGGEIWEVRELSPNAFRESQNLDVLITGSVVKVGEYYGVRITAYGRAGEEVLWEGAGIEGEFKKISTEAGAAARQLVLGRSWCSLTVVARPPGAMITVNGMPGGVGSWSDATLSPGTIELQISATGHKPMIFSEVLAPSEVRSVNVELEKADQPQVLVNSIPTGVSVRLGSIWLGLTPLSVDLPDRVMPITFEQEGYRTRTLPLYPDSERLTVPLEYVLIDPAAHLAERRRKLNNSIAWFSFSLAPTVILLGVSQNYADMNINSTTQEDYEDSYHAYQVSYGLMWGSVAINLGLLVNVFVNLSKYLKAAEDLSQ
jgi:hypothetical protein